MKTSIPYRYVRILLVQYLLYVSSQIGFDRSSELVNMSAVIDLNEDGSNLKMGVSALFLFLLSSLCFCPSDR